MESHETRRVEGPVQRSGDKHGAYIVFYKLMLDLMTNHSVQSSSYECTSRAFNCLTPIILILSRFLRWGRKSHFAAIWICILNTGFLDMTFLSTTCWVVSYFSLSTNSVMASLSIRSLVWLLDFWQLVSTYSLKYSIASYIFSSYLCAI